MTSHLSVSSIQKSTAAVTPALSTSTAATGFSSILDALGGGAGNDTLIGAIQNLLPHGDATKTGFSAPLSTTAGTLPATADGNDAGTPPKLLKELVSALGDLDKAEQSGAPVDKDLLKRAKDAIDAIAAFLAAQQPGAAATPVATPKSDAAGSVTDATTDGDSKTAAATQAANATLGKLATRLEALSTASAKTDPDLAAKLEMLGKSLAPAKLTADTISALGLDAKGTDSDPKLAAAVNDFVNAKASATTPAQPTLAAPLLKLPSGTSLVGGADKTKATGISHTTAAKSGDQPAAAAPATTKDPAPTHAASDDASVQTAVKQVAEKTTDKAANASDATDVKAAPTGPADTTSAAATPNAAPASVAGPTIKQAQDAYQAAPAAAVNLPQLAFEIVRHAQQGSNHFQIRLDPADLGRVDVRLAVDGTGSVNAHLTVERSETLDLLKRDAGSLNQALAQAGLDGSKTNLQFSLSQNPFARQDNGGGNNGGQTASTAADDDGAVAPPASVATLYRGTASAAALNIFV